MRCPRTGARRQTDRRADSRRKAHPRTVRANFIGRATRTTFSPRLSPSRSRPSSERCTPLDEVRRTRRHGPRTGHVPPHGRRTHLQCGCLARQCTLRDTTTDVGADVLSFGGTKNGLMGGEAVVFFSTRASRSNMHFIRKQQMQLASKMRFFSAQFVALLEDDLWLRNAQHANAMAQQLAKPSPNAPGVTITQGAGQRRFATFPRQRSRNSRRPTRSTFGTRPSAKCAGCARGTPPKTTSTSSES